MNFHVFIISFNFKAHIIIILKFKFRHFLQTILKFLIPGSFIEIHVKFFNSNEVFIPVVFDEKRINTY